jgi:hypothetical protein
MTRLVRQVPAAPATIIAAAPGWFRAIRMHGVTWWLDPVVAWQIIAPPEPRYPDSRFAGHFARAITGCGTEYNPAVVDLALRRPDGRFVVFGIGGDVVLEDEADLNEYVWRRSIVVPECGP